MDARTKYEIQKLNLQRIAITKLAICLWRTSDVRTKLREFLMNINSPYTGYRQIGSFDKMEEWPVLTKLVLKKLEQIDLPSSLKSELASAIVGIGVEICAWYTYIRAHCGVQDSLNCVEKINWTYYGTIDQVKTIKMILIDNPNLNPIIMYRIACENMMKESVDDIGKTTDQNIITICLNRIDPESYSYFMLYWQCYRSKDFSQLNQELQENTYLDNQLYNSINARMLCLATKAGNYQAMKYFWNELNQNERDKNVVKMASIAIESFEGYRINYARDVNFGHVCIFLLNQMTSYQRSQFFQDHFLHCFEVLSIWPWLEFTMACIDEGWQYLPSKDNDDNNMLDIVVENMYYMNLLGCSLKYNKYRTIFHYLYIRIPSYLKSFYEPNDKAVLQWICRLYELWDTSSLTLLFNTVEDSERRRLLEAGSWKLKSLMKESKWEELKEFKKEILSQEDINFLKEHFEVQDLVMTEGCAVNKSLGWLCDT